MGLQESRNAFFAGSLYACLYWAGRVELCALPDAIYKAYKKVLRPVKAVQGTDEAADAGEEDAQ